MKILLIYNKKTAHKLSARNLEVVQSELQKQHIDYKVVFTNYKRHAIELVQQADFSNYDAVVGAGGDGTLFELVNGYMHNPSEKRIPIGIIPVGTGNSFSRDIGLNTPDIRESIAIIANRKTLAIDLGHFQTTTQGWYYANILGMGFVTDVQKTAQYFKIFGNLAYTIGVFYRLISLKTNLLDIKIDGVPYQFDAILTEISNSRYTANYLMAPNARINDGLLDVTIAKKMRRGRLIKIFTKIFDGKHINYDEVITFQAKEIEISMDEIRPLGPDGEIEGFSPLKITCVRHALEIFTA